MQIGYNVEKVDWFDFQLSKTMDLLTKTSSIATLSSAALPCATWIS